MKLFKNTKIRKENILDLLSIHPSHRFQLWRWYLEKPISETYTWSFQESKPYQTKPSIPSLITRTGSHRREKKNCYYTGPSNLEGTIETSSSPCLEWTVRFTPYYILETFLYQENQLYSILVQVFKMMNLFYWENKESCEKRFKGEKRL